MPFGSSPGSPQPSSPSLLLVETIPTFLTVDKPESDKTTFHCIMSSASGITCMQLDMKNNELHHRGLATPVTPAVRGPEFASKPPKDTDELYSIANPESINKSPTVQDHSPEVT